MTKLQIHFEILQLLLKASSKQQVGDICHDAFLYRDKEKIPNHVLTPIVGTMAVDIAEASKLMSALSSLIKFILFHGHSSYEIISSLFPEDFHKNLKDLLSKIMVEKYNSWRNAAVMDSATVPKLKEFDWRVDLKMASGKIPRMSEPTCILHMKIHDARHPEGHAERNQSHNVELSKEKLDTMLHGLGRIRDQLSAVAKK